MIRNSIIILKISINSSIIILISKIENSYIFNLYL